MPEMAKTKVVAVLNRLLEAKLAGVVCYPLYLSHPLLDLLLHAQQVDGTR